MLQNTIVSEKKWKHILDTNTTIVPIAIIIIKYWCLL